ncbi:hypothetical protein ABTE60_01755 [Acinetobacter baumannii]
MTDLNKEREAFAQTEFNTFGLDVKDFKTTGEYFMFIGWLMRLELEKAKAQAVPDTHLLVEKSKIETWWQDAEEPENFASRIEDMPSLGQYINGDEIMEITEHHTIHLPSKTIYGVWVDNDGDRSFCTGTLEECRALVASKSGAEG